MEDEVEAALPHRYPFLFVDKLLERVPGQYARGVKSFTRNEWFLQGNGSDQANVPGALLIEAIAQMALLAAKAEGEAEGYPLMAGIGKVRFRDKVVPGDRVELYFRITMARGPWLMGDGQASVDGKRVCELKGASFYRPPDKP